MTRSNIHQIAKSSRVHELRLRPHAAHFWNIIFNGDAALERLFDRYGDVLRVRLPRFFEIVPGVSRVALTRDPALIKPLFAQPHDAVDSVSANRMVEMLYGDRSLFLAEGPEHRRLRTLLLPPLHGESLRQWADLITGSTERESRSWSAQQCVRIHPRILDVSLEVILKITVGISDERLPAWKAAWHELVGLWESEDVATRYALRRLGVLTRFRRLRRAIDRCNELVFDEIARRRAAPACRRTDLLDLMMRADGEPLTDNELRDQVFTMIASGRSTPATTTSWAIERLLRNPLAMQKATAEARSTDSTSYLEAVIHETLRVRPPIVGIARVTRQPVTLGDYDFPADALIYALLRPMHLNKELYDNPNRFMPERFLESPPSVHRFIPFGGGPHRCLGSRFAIYETALMLRTILRTVDLASVIPHDEKVKRKAAAYVPGNGVLVHARPIRAVAIG